MEGIDAGVTRPQPDGTVTTDLKPESTLRKELEKSLLNFDAAIAHFASDVFDCSEK